MLDSVRSPLTVRVTSSIFIFIIFYLYQNLYTFLIRDDKRRSSSIYLFDDRLSFSVKNTSPKNRFLFLVISDLVYTSDSVTLK